VIGGIVIVGVGGTLIATLLWPKSYTAHAIISFGQFKRPVIRPNDAEMLLSSEEILRPAVASTTASTTVADLRQRLTLQLVPRERVIEKTRRELFFGELSVSAPTPETARELASAVTRRFVEHGNKVYRTQRSRLQHRRESLTARITALGREIRALRRAIPDRSYARSGSSEHEALVELARKRETLAAKRQKVKDRLVRGQPFATIVHARDADVRVRPNVPTTTTIALVISIVIGVLVAFIRGQRDTDV